MIIGPRTLDQLDENLAGFTLQLPADAIARLDGISAMRRLNGRSGSPRGGRIPQSGRYGPIPGRSSDRARPGTVRTCQQVHSAEAAREVDGPDFSCGRRLQAMTVAIASATKILNSIPSNRCIGRLCAAPAYG